MLHGGCASPWKGCCNARTLRGKGISTALASNSPSFTSRSTKSRRGQDLPLTRATLSAEKVLDDSDVAALFGLEMTETTRIDAPAPTASKLLASRQAVAGSSPFSASSCSRMESRSPSMASRNTERASSSGFTVLLPIDLSVSQASSKAASKSTSEWSRGGAGANDNLCARAHEREGPQLSLRNDRP